MRLKRLAVLAVTLLAVGVAIVILLRDSSDLFKQNINLNIPLVVMSFFLACLGLLVELFVWRRILAAYGIHQSIRNDMRMYCYSALGAVLPGSIWSIVGRTVLYQRRGVNGLRVATASVSEALIIGIAAMGVYAVITILYPDVSLLQHSEIGLGFACLSLVLIYPPIFNGIIRRVWRYSKRLGDPVFVNFRPAELVSWIIGDVVVILFGGLSLFVLLNSLTSVSLTSLCQVIGVWAAGAAAGNLFFWFPGTFLLRDGALVITLTPLMPISSAILFTLVVRVWLIISLVLLAALVWLIFDLPPLVRSALHLPPTP